MTISGDFNTMNKALKAAESLARVRRCGSCREGTVGRKLPR